MSDKIGVVVTTEHRGVFFGYVEEMPDLDKSKTVVLDKARMCIYWPEWQHGVVGLAANGPADGSKISPAAPAIALSDVLSVMVCSSTAIKMWEKEKWN